jgi:hypothetical protein
LNSKTLRFLFGGLLTIGLASLGFGMAGGLSAGLTAGTGSGGLESAATVALCALSGMMVGTLVAIFLTLRLALPHLVRCAVIALLLGIASVGFFVWRGKQRKKRPNPSISQIMKCQVVPKVYYFE